jgi:hypothetical protein
MATTRLKELSEAARNQAIALAAAAETVALRSDQTNEALRRQQRDLQGVSEHANARLTEVRTVLREQTGELAAATDKAAERLQSMGETYRRQASELTAAAEDATSRAKDAAVAFGSQVENLTRAATEAAAQAERVRKSAISVQQDTFLSAATFIIETLQSIAVDLSRVLEAEIPDPIWKRYHAGDRAIFTRQLLRLQDRNAPNLIMQKFESDPGFRDYVLRYLNQFETLLAQAREVDHQDVLGATFVTADVGKLYLLLSNALGRLKH